jgi:chemotaxis protein CheX
MRNDILAPFTEAACRTLKLLLDVDADAAASEVIDVCVEDEARINIAVGITGDLSGEALYRFPEQTTLEIVKMMSGMEFTEIDEFVLSALGEVANIISGNAVTDLTNRDLTCDILPPRILDDGELPSPGETTYVFSTKIHTSIGEVEVLLQVKKD